MGLSEGFAGSWEAFLGVGVLSLVGMWGGGGRSGGGGLVGIFGMHACSVEPPSAGDVLAMGLP